MDWARVVDVCGRSSTGAWSFGSGYLIAPNLVLTARHVVADSGGTPFEDLTVRLLADGRPFACELAWAGSDGVDAALLRVTDSDGPRCERVRWGQLVTAMPGVACEAVGFPLAMEQAGGLRDTEHLRGEINPGTGLLSARLYVHVARGAPRHGMWVGMSGAALFCGPLLVGVVVEDPPAFESRRLIAEPVTRLLADPAFRDLVGSDAVAEAVELGGERRVVQPASPASLLRADVEAVRFRSRTQELTRLAAWCEGSGTSVRLLTGPGGQGKTRLARELCRRIQADHEHDWVTHWWEESTSPDPLRAITRPILIVIDYAETRPETVRDVVTATLERSTTTPVRVLLLARSAGDWWRRLLSDRSLALKQTLRGATVEELPPLEDTLEGRRPAFHDALTDLAGALERIGRSHVPVTDVPEPDLRTGRFAGPGAALTLQMTALVGLLGEDPRADDPVEEILLFHESRYWKETAAEHRVDLSDVTLERAVAVAALCSAADERDACGLFARVPGLRDQSEDMQLRVARWLRDLYPPAFSDPRLRTSASSGPYWGSLQPDRLAEHLVSRVVTERPDLLTGLLAATSPDQDRQALTVLARASATHAGLAPILVDLLAEIPGLALPAIGVATQSDHPAPLVTALTQLIEGNHLPIDQLKVIANAVPHQTQALAHFAATLLQQITTAYERLTHLDSDVYLPDLARSLNNLSNRLGELGRREEGLAAIQRAVEIYERLAAANPDAYLPDLDSSLNNLSNRLGELGRREEGLAAIQRAVEIREQLAAANPDAYLPDLAMSYIVHSRMLIRPVPSADAVRLIAQGLAIAIERNLERLVLAAIILLKEAYRDQPLETADAWREATSTEPPEWMTGESSTGREGI